MWSILRCSGLVIFAGAFVLAMPADMRAQESVKSPAPAEPTAPASSGDSADPVALFDRISPAVVKLILQDDDKKEIGVASAFAVEAKGRAFDSDVITFVTNFHAIRGAPNAIVQLDEGQTATVLGVLAEDESVDLAVLWARTPKKPSRFVDIEQVFVPPVGSRIFAIGSPKGLTNTLSEGLVSGYRDSPKGGKWVQITAAISPGSSGGPVLAGDGRLVGVATASLVDGQNLNFAVPANEVRRLLVLVAEVRQGRPLWRGTSISQARNEAYLALGFNDFEKFRRENGDLNDEERRSAYPKYRDSKAESGDQVALLLKGYSKYVEKKYEEAVQILSRAVKAKPSEEDAWAKDFEFLVHFALAEAHYEIEHAWASKNAGFDPEASAYLDATVFSRTVAALLDAKRANPSFAPTLDFLAGCYTWTKQYPEALVAAEFLVQTVPQCAKAYERRGEVYSALGRNQSAVQDFKTAVELNPNTIARINLACAYSKLGQHEESIAVYEKMIAHGYEFPLGLYINLAIEFEAVAKYERSIAACEQAIQHARLEKITLPASVYERLARCRAHVK